MYNIDEILINNTYTKHVLSSYHDPKDTEPTIVKTMMNTSNFLNLFKTAFSCQTEILPKNCRFITTHTDFSKTIILEDEPQIRTILFDGDLNHIVEKHKLTGKYDLYELTKFDLKKKPYKFTLSFPYIVYLMNLDKTNHLISMRVFFRLHPLTSLEDYLLEPCLPNLDGDLNICLGRYPEGDLTILETAKNVINQFWFNSFNYDYYDHCMNYETNPFLCDFFTWSYNTKIDPLFIFSAEWNTMINATPYKVIEEYKQNYLGSNNDFNISNLFNLMDVDYVKNIKNIGTIIRNKNVLESISLPNGDIVSIGDEIIIDDKKFYVTSYLMSSNGRKTGIELEDEENKKTTIDFDEFGKAEIPPTIKIIEQKSYNINEETKIVPGDILFFKNSKDIRKLEKIIKLKDGSYQFKIGKDYFLENIFLNKIAFPFNDIEFNGIKIIENKKYILSYRISSYNIYTIDEVFLINKRVRRGQIYLTFEDANKRHIEILLNDTNYQLSEILDESIGLEEIVYFSNRNIFTNAHKEEVNIVKNKNIVYIIKNNGFGVQNNYDTSNIFQYDYDVCKNFFMNICDKNNTSFSIKSYFNDINYNIGDEVIVIDWTNPNDMFNIRTISKFSYDDDCFYLNLLDDDGNIILFPLVEFKNGLNNFIKVRKVCREINDIKTGSKIKSKFISITDFPKKDCNEIKAFIIDDIVPLVLTSNYRTLRYDNLISNFDIYNPEDKKYDKLKLTEPNLKIKVQTGDLFHENTSIVGCMYSNFEPYLYSLSELKYKFLSYVGGISRLELSSRIGLILPRIKNTDLISRNRKVGIPNMYGNIIEKNNCMFRLYRFWSS